MQLDQAFIGSLRSEVCRGLAWAWLEWRGSEILPSRQDMRLGDIKTILPFVSVYEVPSPDRIIMRLAASEQERVHTMPLRGMNVLDITAPEDREIRSYRVQQMVTTPCGGWGSLMHRLASGREEPAELLALPVRPAEPDQPMQVLTAMVRFPDRNRRGAPEPWSVMYTSHDFHFVDLGAGLPV